MQSAEDRIEEVSYERDVYRDRLDAARIASFQVLSFLLDEAVQADLESDRLRAEVAELRAQRDGLLRMLNTEREACDALLEEIVHLREDLDASCACECDWEAAHGRLLGSVQRMINEVPAAGDWWEAHGNPGAGAVPLLVLFL